MLRRYRGTLPTALALLMLGGAAPALAAPPTSPPPPPGPGGPTDPVLPGGGAPGAPLAPVATAGAYSTATWPLELTLRPVVLGVGMLEIRGDLFIGLSENYAGEPFQITPAVYYGLNEQLTLGVFEDTLCFSGDPFCPNVLDSLGVDAIFALLQQANLNLAVRAAIEARSFDAGFWGIRIGLLGKFYADRLAVQFDPKLLIGLNKRDSGNADILAIPVDIQYQIDQLLAAVLTIGILGPLDSNFGDFYEIPVGFGAHYTVNRQLDVAGQLLFLNLLGRMPGYGPFDGRALQFFVNYRM